MKKIIGLLVCILTFFTVLLHINAETIHIKAGDGSAATYNLEKYFANYDYETIILDIDVTLGPSSTLRLCPVPDGIKTLDLNGHLLDLGSDYGLLLDGIYNGGTIRIIDSSEEKTGRIKNPLLVRNCDHRNDVKCTDLNIDILGGIYNNDKYFMKYATDYTGDSGYAENVNINIDGIKIIIDENISNDTYIFKNLNNNNNMSMKNTIISSNTLTYFSTNDSNVSLSNIVPENSKIVQNYEVIDKSTNVYNLSLNNSKMYFVSNVELLDDIIIENRTYPQSIGGVLLESVDVKWSNPTSSKIILTKIELDRDDIFNWTCYGYCEGYDELPPAQYHMLGRNKIGPKSDLDVGIHNTNILMTDSNNNLYLKTVSYEVENLKVDRPSVINTSLEYNGNEQQLQINGFNSNIMQISGNTGTNPGNYEAIITLNKGYCWQDGSTSSISFQWNIYSLVSSINILGPSDVLIHGNKEQYSIELLPSNASNQAVIWSVENITGQAEIDQNGLLTVIDSGTVKVIAESSDGTNIRDEKIINIQKYVDIDSIYIFAPNKFLDNSKSIYMNAMVYPYNASSKELTWKSSNTTIATINANTGAMTTKNKQGTVTITATATDGSGKSGSITFYVGYPHITIGEETSVGNSSYVTYDTVEWFISNENVLQRTGRYGRTSINNYYYHSIYVKGLAEGQSTVTMKTISGDTLATSTVYVYRPLESINAEESNIVLESTKTKQLEISFNPNDVANEYKKLLYSSDNDNIASVDKNGLVTAHSVGKTNIKVSSQYFGLNLTIPVEVLVYSNSIEVNNTNIVLDDESKEFQIEYLVKPLNATYSNVSFESSDNSIVTVSDTGLIRAVGHGTAKVTITTEDGKTSKEVNVISNITIPIEKIEIDQEELFMYVNEIKTLDATINPSNTTDDKVLSWSSSDESIALVDQDGKVTAVNPGTAIITVITSNNKSANCTVNVLAKINTIGENTEITILNDSNKPIKVGDVVSFNISGQMGYRWDTIQIVRDSDGVDVTEELSINNHNLNEGTLTLPFEFTMPNYDVTIRVICVSMKLNKPIVSISKGNNNSIALNWNKQEEKYTSYDIYRSTDGKKYTHIKTLSKTTSYIDTGLSYGKTYYYKIKGYNFYNGYTGYSNVVKMKVVPNKTNLSIMSAGTNNVKISYSKVSATGYEIYMGTKTSNMKKITTITKNGILSYNKTKLKTNTTYYFKVRAYKTVSGKKVYGPWSNIASTRTAPVKPSLSLSLKSLTEMNLKIGSSKGTSIYQVQRSLDGKTYTTVEELTGAGTLAQGELEIGKTYYFRVRACNSQNRCSGWVTKSLKQTTKTPSISLKTSSKKVTVTLTSVDGADGYEIYRSNYSNKKFSLVKELTSLDELTFDNKTTKGKTYYYKVRSYKIVNGKKVYSSYSGVKKIKSK